MSTAPATSAPKFFPCRQCGAKLEYAPGTTDLTCPYCGTANEIAVSGSVEENDLDAALDTLGRDAAVVTVSSVKCSQCAADVTLPPNVTSFSCPFCGANIVANPTDAAWIRPHAVLPFKITREVAADAFRKWVRSRWFAPTSLRQRATLDTPIDGVYMPAWTYDADTDTWYTGERGDAYYVTVGSGNNRRQERRVRWTSVSGRIQKRFDDVLVLASRSLPSKLANDLEPWDLNAASPYADEFLAGFRAETYQVGLREGFAEAKSEMESAIVSAIRANIGGDEQRIHQRRTSWSNLTFKLLMLPVWLAAYRFHAKVYRFMVNARTGEVQGERPYSAWKITLAVLAGLIVVGVIVVLVRNN